MVLRSGEGNSEASAVNTDLSESGADSTPVKPSEALLPPESKSTDVTETEGSRKTSDRGG